MDSSRLTHARGTMLSSSTTGSVVPSGGDVAEIQSAGSSSALGAAAAVAATAPVPSCIFCQLSPGTTSATTGATEGTSERVVYADEYVYVVHDYRPSARLHLLVIPHEHIRDCSEEHLHKGRLELVRHMRAVGNKMLSEYGHPGEGQRLGFHVAPFISVPHLHLHVLSGVFGGIWRKCACCSPARCFYPCDCLRFKYAESASWYSSIDDVLARIEHGQAKPAPVDQRMDGERYK